jgi:hypothetical protein
LRDSIKNELDVIFFFKPKGGLGKYYINHPSKNKFLI